MDNNRQRFQYEGLKWLYELEIVNDPQLINNLKLNVLVLSRHIKDAEFLIYRENKSILVYLELNWFASKFLRSRLIDEAGQIVSELLPAYKFRVITDKNILNMAVDLVKKALGGKNEKSSSNTDSNALPESNTKNEPVEESNPTDKESNLTESSENKPKSS